MPTLWAGAAVAEACGGWPGPFPGSSSNNQEPRGEMFGGKRGPILAGHPEPPGTNTLNVHDLGKYMFMYLSLHSGRANAGSSPVQRMLQTRSPRHLFLAF